MKKSEMYKMAQCAVVDVPNLTTLTKLEILRELMAKEDLALFTEKEKGLKGSKERSVIPRMLCEHIVYICEKAVKDNVL